MTKGLVMVNLKTDKWYCSCERMDRYTRSCGGQERLHWNIMKWRQNCAIVLSDLTLRSTHIPGASIHKALLVMLASMW